MNSTVGQPVPSLSLPLAQHTVLFWILSLTLPLAVISYWSGYRRIAAGEPPLVPYLLPWLGHGMAFMNDINGFTEWVRSLNPDSPAATVQVAGQHLYLVFDTKLASQIYRRSKNFIFDPFNLMTWGIMGANRSDLEILEMGAQVEKRTPGFKDDGRRVLYDLHRMSGPALTGESLDRLTSLFIDTICREIDTTFPENDAASYEWVRMDLGEFVKKTWTRASIVALFGSHIFTIWPRIEDWLWEFDEHFQSLLTKMPRFMLPKAWALRDEAWEFLEKWEDEALAAEKRGEIKETDDWDPYWGLQWVAVRAKYLIKQGISAKARAGNESVFLWGLNANTIPIAMQVMNQAVLSPTLLSTLQAEISSAQTGPNTFNMAAVTTAPKLKSVLLESLRWATASPSPRVVREDCQLGEYKLLKGSMVIVHSRTLQMDARTWAIDGVPGSAPEEFWAERFLDGDEREEENRIEENQEAETAYAAETFAQAQAQGRSETAKPHKIVEPISGPKSKETQQRMLSMRPFGGGTTLCPGRHFATNEILGGLAALLLRLDVKIDEEALEKNGAPVPNLGKQGGLFPDRGLGVWIRRRRV
ncbi:cytochrome P450-13 [Coleophoma cylindrospora]|uniref:Cytochrome P450-13 n=1 Tax=Coleophoma cylindrospora TaxID=1849047 RepID=A0A3D8QKQ3_9HELO|nr:cytochrome P450-13 [Coleophoma cylindrospora]